MNRSRTRVLAALAVVVVLAAALGIRWAGLGSPARPARGPLARFDKPVPPARVSPPIHVDVPKVPCWSCPASEKWPVRFQTNLDLLAPLGDGPANAALWLKDFAKPQGARLREAEDAMKRRVDGPADVGLVLPPDDPLLKEAEPWADQATMRFYPDVWAAEGASTPIPNLLVALSFARSWVVRAASNPDAPGAIEDCRRAIRWGRLLRQEDATIIQDLVGLASVRIGAEQLYTLAARRGDQPLMLAAAIVQGEAAPQRLRTAEVVTRVAVRAQGTEALGDGKVDDTIGVAKNSPDRRFRNEAIVMLGYARLTGTGAQREKVETALAELKASPDAFVAGNARWALELRREDLKDLGG
ncbi:MAG TPA: hypothetical protein VLJ18_06510 [Thermoanaerobaculia bacterium]|nr:hypothetical protein [Thermoanaerobaculia bacterium]